MKNQYFGDTRDLFKYDLILEILLKSNLKHFTFIPMLTKNEPNNYGGRINYNKARAGTSRMMLKNFLEKCVRENRRNIKELEKFFRNNKLPKKIRLTIYKKNSYFSNKTRKEYFSEINGKLLTRSVILVDPDIGLEVENIRGREEKYIKYEEVKLLYDYMDKHSTLLIFQFIPRVKRKEYFSKVSKRLKQKVTRESPVYYISDNQIVFFVLTKNPKLLNSLKNIIGKYANFYGLTMGKN